MCESVYSKGQTHENSPRKSHVEIKERVKREDLDDATLGLIGASYEAAFPEMLYDSVVLNILAVEACKLLNDYRNSCSGETNFHSTLRVFCFSLLCGFILKLTAKLELSVSRDH